MIRMLIIVLCLVAGLVAAFPNLNVNKAKAKRAVEILKQNNFNFHQLTKRSVNKKDALADLTEELENLLKRQGGGTETSGQEHDNQQGQGQQEDPCAGRPGNPLEELSEYREEDHYMHFLCKLRTADPFREMIEQMEQATALIMETMNECTGTPVYKLPDDLEDLKNQATAAYKVGNSEHSAAEKWDAFITELHFLGEKYKQYEEKGIQAAENSDKWTPFCTDVVTALDREIEMLNTACFIYKLHVEGWL